MRVTGTYKVFAKSLVFVSLLTLAQLTQAAAPISNGDKLAHDAKNR